MKSTPFHWKKVVISAAAASAVIAALFYSGYAYWTLRYENAALRTDAAQTEREMVGLEENLAITRGSLETTEGMLASTSQSLEAEQEKNSMFEGQISQISGTVGDLQKLSNTDPQLLEKYSKVYFLSENYVPAALSEIDPQYVFNKTTTELFLTGALPKLEAMMAAAGRDGVTLQVVSAYRSFYDQASLKFGYTITYGAGTANQFSAEQGYSEHQLGTAVDFTTPKVGSLSSKFAAGDGYQWLTANAYRFGFILSYPKGNAYYIFEPWHWRYVGVALATKLYENNQYFYDLTQREIDTYLISFFD